jgi:hypothetical protein
MPTEEQIIADLQAFRDPATELEVSSGQSGFLVTMVREGDQRQYFFSRYNLSVQRRDARGRSWASFDSLLASDEFAGLQLLADTQRRLLRAKNIGEYLEPAGTLRSNNGEITNINFAKFVDAIRPQGKDVFNCVLVDGPAGVGKTSLIERMVLERAQPNSSVPILHVTSRGRRLTNLRDALAGTLDELRAKFRSTEVPALVRNNLIQVALDGFDEFVDPDGYKDAWAALKDFIRECGTAGPLILAGRDTFFDQQRFEDQISSIGRNPEIVVVRLKEVALADAKTWLIERGWTREDVESDDTRIYLRNGSYMLRPFFLSRIAPLRGWMALKEARTSPQSFVIDSMVSREAKILSQAASLDTIDVEAALNSLFEDIAEDMADREVDSVPLNYLRFVGEVSFKGLIPDNSIERLLHSLGSIALLEKGDTSDTVRFPHTEITNRFLMRSLIRQLSKNREPVFLGRIILGMDRVEAFVERMLEVAQDDATSTFRRLKAALTLERRSARFDSNIGGLLLSALSCPEAVSEPGEAIAGVNASEVRIMFEGAEAELVDCSIYRLDVQNCDMSNMRFENTFVSFVMADRNTRWGASIPKIDVIQVEGPDGPSLLRSEGEKGDWIGSHSIRPNVGIDRLDVELPLVKHFDRVCRRFLAQVQIRDVPDDRGSFLLHNHLWDEMKPILLEEGRLKIISRAVQGPARAFYTMIDPEELLWPTTEEGKRIRGRIIEKARG